ncbi:MAG: HEAT repeat domain-containing protein, partial [Candidatus Brocadiales bacterium]|nr:HEAT repeat domain-containing protein [Candidatus Brocadiales bacterium]
TALIILKEMGETAVPLLSILLNDRDDDVRKFAIDLIHDIQYCDYPEKLVVMLIEDTNVNVRAAAAKTLGALQYTESIQLLIEALKDEEWVAFSALEALTLFNDDSSIDPIIRLIDHFSDTIRFAAIEALGKIGNPKATPRLLEFLAKAEGFEKMVTVKSLVQIGDIEKAPEVKGILYDMLKESEWDDKIIAIQGLVALNESASIPQMMDIAGELDMSHPDHEDYIYMIRDAIIGFGCNKHLLNILKNESMRYKGKVMAIEIAGTIRCAEAVPYLINLLNSEYRDVKRSCIKSLGEIKNDEAQTYLMMAIKDEDSHVRKSAVSALGSISDMSAFEPLMNMLHQEIYNDVIDAFICALIHINEELFISRISEFSENIKNLVSDRVNGFNPEISC